MYAPQPPARSDDPWRPIPPSPAAIPEPPVYLAGHPAYVEAMRPRRVWLRIPISRPIVTPLLSVVLVLIYLPMAFFPQVDAALLDWGAKTNPAIAEGEWWRLITAMFLHGSVLGIPFLHLVFNVYALYVIGMELEAFIGSARFAAIYFVSGLAGSIASFAFSPQSGVGASGAIFGIVGALGVYFGLHRGLFGRLGQLQFWNIVVVILLNVGLGLSGVLPIDNAAHIGGLLGGIAMGFALCPRYRLGSWRETNVRDIVKATGGALSWLTALLISLDVIFAFYVTLLLYNDGIRFYFL